MADIFQGCGQYALLIVNMMELIKDQEFLSRVLLLIAIHPSYDSLRSSTRPCNVSNPVFRPGSY